MIDWKVGDKVVCVDATNASALHEGKVYTIAAFNVYPTHRGFWDKALMVELVEVPLAPLGQVCAFFPRRFRPLINKPATTEFFEKLCRDAVKEREVLV